MACMDARDENLRPHRARLARLATGVLAALLAWGLWQGYGAWILGVLLAGAGAHAP
jgi:hypothetical protein